MIVLHKFVPAWGLPDTSPFCIKVETYLRMVGLEYDSVASDPRKAPKQKCPFIEEDGVVVCDSSAIVRHFENKLPEPLDAGLDAKQRAVSAAFKALLEEHLYFVIVWLRWVDPEGWKTFKPTVHGIGVQLGLPSVVIPLVAEVLRYQNKRSVWLQGTGRHSPEEITAIGIQHMRSVSEWIGGQSFFLGDRPRTIDATVYGFLASVIWAPFDGPIKQEALRLSNLTSYCERMKAHYWSGHAQPALPGDGPASLRSAVRA